VIGITDSGTQSIEKTPVDSGRSWCGVGNLKRIYSFITAFRVLWLIPLSGILCLTATAVQAQQFSIDDFAPIAAKTGNGWWSPERTASTVLAPHLQLMISTPARFALSEPVRNSTTQQRNYLADERTDNPMVSLGSFGLADGAGSPEVSPLVEGELLAPRSFFSVLVAKYAMWESSLADTRSLVNVNGMQVYPLVQIDYAQWRLPIALYAPPLRGSNSR
jgi:hypothetical protein